jgi:norsolorinic acid ketoreductase
MIVFAGAHDPAPQSLKDLVAKHPNVHPIKLISGDEADKAAAAAEIQKTAGHLDIVITNTGTPSPSFLL